MIGAAPTMIQMLLDEPSIASADFSRLKWVGYGAAPMPPDLLMRAMQVMNVEFSQGYGMTENTGMTTMLAAEDHKPPVIPDASVGRPLAGVELKIVDGGGIALSPVRSARCGSSQPR